MKIPFTRPRYWTTPPASILQDAGAPVHIPLEHTAYDVAAIFANCGISCNPHGVTVGASVVLYHMDLHDLRQYTKALRAAPMIGAALHSPVTIGASTVAHFCVSVARSERQPIPLKRVILTTAFNDTRSPTSTVLGATVDNNPLVIDIAKMPHLLIAGATGSGKSVLLHSIIGSMLYRGTPSTLQLLMIDPKQVELTAYDGLPHLVRPVITNVQIAVSVLDRVCEVMDDRYKDIRRGITNHPRLVIVIDELADLMLTSKKAVEPAIVRIAQLGRAAGIHLIIATQRPTVNVVTGLIKANMPARIALTMASYRDAGVMEVSGAAKLAGRGDALFQSPDHTIAPIRFQAAYTSDADVAAIVRYWKSKEALRHA